MKNFLPYSGAAILSLAFCSLPTSMVAQANLSPQELAFENLTKYTQEASLLIHPEKQADIENYRKRFQRTGYRKSKFIHNKNQWQEPLKQLELAGYFADLNMIEGKLFPNGVGHMENNSEKMADFLEEAWNRIAIIADAYIEGNLSFDKAYTEGLLKAIVHYGDIETRRFNNSNRFHTSCFAIPTAAMNTYYSFLDRMDEIESGAPATELELKAVEMLKAVALQAWTQPLRNDETDNDVSSVERFRNHVWWVGGNALAYRSLLPVACMIKSVPMIDVLAEVSQRAISMTSQHTYGSAFWTEGFTADGAGWGHGMQCLVWGYPIDGTNTALTLMSYFKDTSWDKKLGEENAYAIMNYLRGSNWYYYKGYTLPGLGRTMFLYQAKPEHIKSHILVENIQKNGWSSSFSESEGKELNDLAQAVRIDNKNIEMSDYPEGMYNGIRWFFNNDDLIRKNDDYHVFINMASVRCDGIESAPPQDNYNYTTCDGSTLFQRSGNDYLNVFGAYDILRAPGITSRVGMNHLGPVRNWRGYCSKHNYAGGATNNNDFGVAGYIFDKMNASMKDNVNDSAGRINDNEFLYGVQAYKSYFFFGDYMMALGSGITSLNPSFDENVETTIEQTESKNRIYTWFEGKEADLKKGQHVFRSTAKDLDWVIQEDQFAYSVLPEYVAGSYAKVETRKTDWVKYNSSNASMKELPSSVEVLQIGDVHGAHPENDEYGYVVYLGKGNPVSILPFEILHHDKQVAAAAMRDGSVFQAVFYDANLPVEDNRGHQISVSVPAVVMINYLSPSELEIAINDPQMNKDLEQIDVQIDDQKYTISMPKGNLAGQVVKQRFKTDMSARLCNIRSVSSN